jgi:hypothetical protein
MPGGITPEGGGLKLQGPSVGQSCRRIGGGLMERSFKASGLPVETDEKRGDA